MADAAWDIVVGVKNQQEIERLNEEIEKGEAAIARHIAVLQMQGRAVQQNDPLFRQYGTSVAAATAKIKELEPAGAAGARGLLQVGYAIDDVQYGFRGIVNNIPQIVMGLGGGAGIAGVAAIAAVAVNQLINHWGELIQAFDGGATLREAEAMKELAEATKTAHEHAEKLAAMKTGPGKMAEEATDKAVVDIGERALEQGIAGVLRRENPLKDKVEVSRPVQGAFGHSENVKSEYGPGTPEYAAYANAENEKTLALANAMAGDVSKNNETRMRVMGMVNADPDLFPGDALKKLQAASPEQQADKAMEKAREKRRKVMDKGLDERTKRDIRDEEEADRKLTAALNAQGQEIERETLAAKKRDEERRWAQKEGDIDALQDKQKALREQAGEAKKSQIFGGTKAFADHTMTSSMEGLSKQKLAEAKELNKKIEALRADLKNDRRGARLL